MTEVALRDVASFLSGGTPSKANPAFWSGAIPWVSPKDMQASRIEDTEDHISEQALSSSATKLVEPGTLLVVARSGILARRLPVALTTVPVAFNQDIKAVVPDENRLLPEFALWVLRSREPEVLARGVKLGATVHSLASGYLENLRFRLPPLDEQRRIVDLLDRAAGLKRLAEEAKAKARELIPALFLEMFGDPATNPKGWPMVTLGDVCERRTGTCDPRRSPGASFTYIDISAVSAAEKRIVQPKIVPNAEAPSRARKVVRGGDVILSMTRPNLNAVAMVPDELDGSVASTGFAVLRATNLCDPAFLFILSQSDFFVRTLVDQVSGALYPAVTEAQVRSISIPLPPIDLQDAFGERLQTVMNVEEHARTAATAAERTSAALMARLFAG